MVDDAKSVSIAIDAMGGDNGPSEIIAGVALALKELTHEDRVLLVGDAAVLEPLITDEGLADNERVSVLHSSEIIGMEEKPIQSLRRKKDSSMVRAIESVREGRAQALLSCGNTGSLMAGSTLNLRRLEGLERPALATVIPTAKHYFILIDAGANTNPSPSHIVHNAILGTHYALSTLQTPQPRVGLLSIGTEEGKGTDLIQHSHELLKSIDSLINYEGLIEGFHVFSDQVEVVLCDGFVGNIVLKVCESLSCNLGTYLKDELYKSPVRRIGAFLARGAFRTMRRRLNPESYGGAPLLGLSSTVFKAHGSSNRYAICSAVQMGLKAVRSYRNKEIVAALAEANRQIKEKAEALSNPPA